MMRRPLLDGAVVATVTATALFLLANAWWVIAAGLWAGLAALIWGKGSRRG
jgi:hypothetical protein